MSPCGIVRYGAKTTAASEQKMKESMATKSELALFGGAAMFGNAAKKLMDRRGTALPVGVRSGRVR